MTVLHAGGKFDKQNYATSSGLNGIGNKAITALSTKLQVWSNNAKDKKWHTQTFEKAKIVSVLRNLKSDENAELPENLSWIKSKAEKEYKKAEKTIPEHMGASAVYYAFCDSDGDERVLEEVIQENYRKPLLKAKNYYQNSVKLGLDLSGGMNIIVKADLDAALAKQKENSEVANPDANWC